MTSLRPLITIIIIYSMAAPAGTKRSHDGIPVQNSPATMPEPNPQSSQIVSIFETFRDELDEHYDRRERIIKTSRDITALSKKMYVSIYMTD